MKSRALSSRCISPLWRILKVSGYVQILVWISKAATGEVVVRTLSGNGISSDCTDYGTGDPLSFHDTSRPTGIGEDLAYYLTESQQAYICGWAPISSLMKEDKVKVAIGFLLQVLPNVRKKKSQHEKRIEKCLLFQHFWNLKIILKLFFSAIYGGCFQTPL